MMSFPSSVFYEKKSAKNNFFCPKTTFVIKQASKLRIKRAKKSRDNKLHKVLYFTEIVKKSQ